MDDQAILTRAQQVMDVEIEGMTLARKALDDSFVQVARRVYGILAHGGKIVCTGVGKNLIIAEKISATLASTGSTSVVMNPMQAMHGDLGMLTPNDIVLALSFSGESDEIIKLVPAVRRLNVPVIAVVGNPKSTLASMAELVLEVRINREACPFGIAPTTSTTATMALGDALALVLLDLRQFKKENFARLHPAGAIGRALILRVRDIMRPTEKIACLPQTANVFDAITAMTANKSGAAVLVDAAGKLAGIFTDGDLRRHLSEGRDILHSPLDPIMTHHPININVKAYAVDVLKIFEKTHIDDLPVVDDDGKLVGCIDIQDLPKMKVM